MENELNDLRLLQIRYLRSVEIFHACSSVSSINSSTARTSSRPSTQMLLSARSKPTTKPRISTEVKIMPVNKKNNTSLAQDVESNVSVCSSFNNQCPTDCCINGRCAPSAHCLPHKAARGGRGGGGGGGRGGGSRGGRFSGGSFRAGGGVRSSGSGRSSSRAWVIALAILVPVLVFCCPILFCCCWYKCQK